MFSFFCSNYFWYYISQTFSQKRKQFNSVFHISFTQSKPNLFASLALYFNEADYTTQRLQPQIYQMSADISQMKDFAGGKKS
jgi:hypothetical protein